MHGVGHPFAEKAFELYGFAPFTPVVEQQFPDPEFPTVKFPNPEEKGGYRSPSSFIFLDTRHFRRRSCKLLNRILDSPTS